MAARRSAVHPATGVRNITFGDNYSGIVVDFNSNTSFGSVNTNIGSVLTRAG